jgi:hypothetical protein
MSLHKHRHNLKENFLEKSKLALQSSKDSHRVGWNVARILEIESNTMYSKYMQSAHVAHLTNLISQPSLDISSIQMPLIINDISNSQSVWAARIFIDIYMINSRVQFFVPKMALAVRQYIFINLQFMGFIFHFLF